MEIFRKTVKADKEDKMSESDSSKSEFKFCGRFPALA